MGCGGSMANLQLLKGQLRSQFQNHTLVVWCWADLSCSGHSFLNCEYRALNKWLFKSPSISNVLIYSEAIFLEYGWCVLDCTRRWKIQCGLWGQVFALRAEKSFSNSLHVPVTLLRPVANAAAILDTFHFRQPCLLHPLWSRPFCSHSHLPSLELSSWLILWLQTSLPLLLLPGPSHSSLLPRGFK